MQYSLRMSMFASVILLLTSQLATAQKDVNYDEAMVPSFQLPDALLMEDGTSVDDSTMWVQRRRPELLQLFTSEVYGRAPAHPDDLHWVEFERGDDAFDGAAIRKQITIFFSADEAGPRMDLLMYLPKDIEKPVPVFLGLNFRGNHTITDDPRVRISQSWMRPGDGVVDQRATEATRGSQKSRWRIRRALSRGFGVATVYYGDIDPDTDDNFSNGVHQMFHRDRKPEADEWGSIATWAWGLSCALDYLVTDPDVDQDRVIVMGHSRLGKTALWAGAHDPRFALVISNDSGCGGAALSRRRFGEKVKQINTAFPHWFADNFNKYNDRENELPVDQHQLVALMAPRPVLICSAEDDRWADPRGEFLAAFHASPVYQLFGKRGIPEAQMPKVNQLVGEGVAYHIRPGKHDVTLVDWDAYLKFAESSWEKN